MSKLPTLFHPPPLLLAVSAICAIRVGDATAAARLANAVASSTLEFADGSVVRLSCDGVDAARADKSCQLNYEGGGRQARLVLSDISMYGYTRIDGIFFVYGSTEYRIFPSPSRPLRVMPKFAALALPHESILACAGASLS